MRSGPALFSLVSGKQEHAGMSGDHHAEGIESNSLLHHIGQFPLPVGINLEDMFDTQTLKNLPDWDRVNLLVEIPPGTGVILMSGHGGGAVLHDDQGQVVFIKQSVD